MKTRLEDVANTLADAPESVPMGSIWQHYKGGTYIVVGHSVDTERLDVLISYRRIAGPDFDAVTEANLIYSRPLEIWQTRTPSGVDRFTRIS